MTEPTLEEIDKAIHKWLGNCVHDGERRTQHNRGAQSHIFCLLCGMGWHEYRPPEIPSYHSDLNLCAEMEKGMLAKNIPEVEWYFDSIREQARDFNITVFYSKFISAPPEIRIRAWWKAIGQHLEKAK